MYTYITVIITSITAATVRLEGIVLDTLKDCTCCLASFFFRNFVRHLIVKNPRGRLTADQALHVRMGMEAGGRIGVGAKVKHY